MTVTDRDPHIFNAALLFRMDYERLLHLRHGTADDVDRLKYYRTVAKRVVFYYEARCDVDETYKAMSLMSTTNVATDHAMFPGLTRSEVAEWYAILDAAPNRDVSWFPVQRREGGGWVYTNTKNWPQVFARREDAIDELMLDVQLGEYK